MTAQSTAPSRPLHRTPGQRHDEEIGVRLRKAAGQLTGVQAMYEAERYCVDVLDQLAAVAAAVDAVAVLVLEDHISACVRQAIDDGDTDRAVGELAGAVRRFVRTR